MPRMVFAALGFVVLAAPAIAHGSAANTSSARVAIANHKALREPTNAGFLGAVQVYAYEDGATYRLFAAPERVTDIALEPGETITSVAAGDTVRWTVGDTTSGSGEGLRVHILVKPFSAGLHTNLVITTDKRAYHLELTSNAAAAMTALSWTYPRKALLLLQRKQEAAAAAAPVAAGIMMANLHFDYAISGDKPDWRPLRAFDDGRQTYIEFPASLPMGEAPPLFVVGSKGEAELVNYRQSGRFYVVDRLFGAAELRLGGKRQEVVRIARVDPRTHRRGRGS
ncbi:conjugal transfer protein TrbG [Novosphingobium malaysiense]|uniref:Conjugal transfer protein TrbG n=2 Tax=Novosphingobium malaysiense TaxID=1348853 RepID=A0A0B1ZMR5_9SPHN|nr:conjugal transfer protein TrbG [Novosphingobium malaysiense]